MADLVIICNLYLDIHKYIKGVTKVHWSMRLINEARNAVR